MSVAAIDVETYTPGRFQVIEGGTTSKKFADHTLEFAMLFLVYSSSTTSKNNAPILDCGVMTLGFIGWHFTGFIGYMQSCSKLWVDCIWFRSLCLGFAVCRREHLCPHAGHNVSCLHEAKLE